MKKRAAMLLAGMMVLSLAVPCAAGAEETNDSEYYYVNGKAPEEVTEIFFSGAGSQSFLTGAEDE